MLAVGLFIAFWVIVALGLFLIAARGGRSRVRRGLTRGATRSAVVLFVATAAVFGAALPILMLTGNHNNANAQVSGIRLNAAEKAGRQLFGQHCGVCHTLAAANAAGKVGPDLDQLRPTASIVAHTIANGCLPNASTSSNPDEICLGQGVMPADVVTGRQATDVAEFVARVTGSSTSVSSGSSSSSSPSSSAPAPSTTTTTTTSAASSPAPSGAAHTLDVAAAPGGELKFTTSKLTTKAGKITFVFTNKSPLPHNLTIQQGTNGKVLGATPTFTGGSRSFTVTLTAGTYTYYCSVPGHRQAGMVGTLTVT